MKLIENFIYFGADKPLVIALTVGICVQVIKVIIRLIFYKELRLQTFFESGGMPSAHSSAVCALSISVGMIEGFYSTIFQVTAFISLFVIYDAAGVRAAAGKQAQILNQIIIKIFKTRKKPEQLRELIGHTPIEVMVGILIGTLVGYYWTGLLYK